MTDLDRSSLEALAEAAGRGLFDPLRHRRDARGRWAKHPLGGVEYTAPVRIDSPIYGKDVYGHVQTVLPGGAVQVRVEDPGQEHPAVKDMMGDFGGEYDQLEFIDTVPYTAIRDTGTGDTIPDPIKAIAQIELQRAHAAREKARAERIDRLRQEIRTGRRPSAFPEMPPLRRA